jgi:lipoprotein-anchoring transpeptidase ErfK/SrfK
VALLTALLLSGTALAGCSAESDPGPEAGATTALPTPSATPAPSPEPSEDPSAEASDEPGQEPSDEPADDAGVPDDSDGERDDDGKPDDGKRDDAAGDSPGDETAGDDGPGGEDAEDEKDAKPELPAYVAFGENSERVATIQQRLQYLGYHLTAVDGAYGGETQQALWALQKAGGLYRDGVVGPETQRALDKGVAPRPRSTSGKVLEIDIARQLVLAVENGKVVRTINAASGNGERFQTQGRTYTASTPRGDFAVYREIDGMHASTLELGDMWRPKYFNGAIAVHGSGSVPPFPASHGCVRVSNAAMNWIWDVWGAPAGTRVLVY